MNELNIAKTLVVKRREKGINQDELASYIGVSKASVSKWETGQSYPDITVLPQLATYFNISVDELIDYQPQMTKEDIQKLYIRLAKDFTEKPFDEVMGAVREVVKKYYSCFPLLLQLGALILNHQNLAPETKRNAIIGEAITLFQRVKAESGDFALSKEANLLEATSYLMLGEATRIIDLLSDRNRPTLNESNLLATGYSMIGQSNKAKEISQIGSYENLINLLQDLLNLYRFELDNPPMANKLLYRILQIAELFELDELHPATMFSVYLTAAAGYVMEGNNESALSMIQKYADLATSSIYPLKLHGDDFFDRIEKWLTELDLGTEAPRNEKAIKQSIVDAVTVNPMFAALHGEFRYKCIVDRLETIKNEDNQKD